ncbi:MAG: hypothetical protein OHK0017_10370 [Patescibacteria group bacterium]
MDSTKPVITQPELPVLSFEAEIKEIIKNNPVAIIVGETGSGKTTEIGRMMHEVVGGKIVTTQPRRPAAITVAEYVAQKHHNEEVGGQVGYHIRFHDTTHRGSALDYVTDGILIEQLLATKTLPDYSGVILDEAHIRNLNVDFLMGLILGVNRARKEQGMELLKILITSATIPAEKFSDFFGGAPVLQIPGRMFPVETFYQKLPKNYIEAIVEKVSKVEREGLEGDVLIFVPGEGEIRRTISSLAHAGLGTKLEILPFYGQQSIKEQEKVFQRYPRRKVVVATNVAETSLTIDGVKIVIDVGLQRASVYDHHTGISSLQDEPASLAAINQRRGRAGRTAPGICFRLFPQDLNRPEYDVPEILRTNLAGTVLKMKRLGIRDVIGFEFIDKPSGSTLRKAIQTLKTLGALDDLENITPIGEIMCNLPLDPHISRMVVEARKYGCVDPICTIAAFLSSKSVFDRSGGEIEAAEAAHERFKTDSKGHALSDPECFLKVWREYVRHQDDAVSWVEKNFLNPKVLQEVALIRDDLQTTLRYSGIQISDSNDSLAIAKSITAGVIGNLLEKMGREEYRRLFGPGEGITIHPSSAMRLGPLPRYIVAGEIMINAAGYAGAFQCQPVELSWLPEIASQMLQKEEIPSQIVTRRGRKYGSYRYYLKVDGRFLFNLVEEIDPEEFARLLSLKRGRRKVSKSRTKSGKRKSHGGHTKTRNRKIGRG